MLLTDLLPRIVQSASYSIQDHQPGGGAAHSDLGSPAPVLGLKKKKFPVAKRWKTEVNMRVQSLLLWVPC